MSAATHLILTLDNVLRRMCMYVLHVALVIKPVLEELQGAYRLAQVKRDELALLEHVMRLCERADAAVTADRCVMPLFCPMHR